jgi:hypothetical protein
MIYKRYADRKKIREVDPTCVLIFITSSQDHALDSYSVHGSAFYRCHNSYTREQKDWQ